VGKFAIWVPRGLTVLIINFTPEIIIFFATMESNTHFYGADSREKKSLMGKK
jgi:hypothetical protein